MTVRLNAARQIRTAQHDTLAPSSPRSRGVAPNGQIMGPGKYRWGIKTGTDPEANQVNRTPQDVTIAQMVAWPAPGSLPQNQRIAPQELQVYRLSNVTLVKVKEENDEDYHLILQDAQNNTMVAEIPNPLYAETAPADIRSNIAKVRAQIDAQYQVTTSWQPVGKQVNITGVGFFDDPHGQDGQAGNAVELHPVQEIDWL